MMEFIRTRSTENPYL